jgi:hypothetical protein
MRGLGEHLGRHSVGYVALFVALGGTAWAGSQIGASDIKDNAVRSHHVKDDTLTGKDVDESELKVIRAFDVPLPTPTSDAEVFHVGELTLTASCSFATPPDVQLVVEATSSGSGKQETTYNVREGTGDTDPLSVRNAINSEPKQIVTAVSTASGAEHGGGTLVYHSSSEVVTATFRFFADVDDGCAFAGTVTRADL